MMMLKKTSVQATGLVVTLLAGLALMGCQDEKLQEACTNSCEQRAACDRDKGQESTTSQGACETACLLQGGDFVDKAEACKAETSCGYATCLSKQ